MQENTRSSVLTGPVSTLCLLLYAIKFFLVSASLCSATRRWTPAILHRCPRDELVFAVLPRSGLSSQHAAQSSDPQGPEAPEVSSNNVGCLSALPTHSRIEAGHCTSVFLFSSLLACWRMFIFNTRPSFSHLNLYFRTLSSVAFLFLITSTLDYHTSRYASVSLRPVLCPQYILVSLNSFMRAETSLSHSLLYP